MHDLKKPVPVKDIKKAASEIEALGSSVSFPEEGKEDHVGFYFSWANDDGSEVFYDWHQKYFKEYKRKGRTINHLGYRQDINDILCKYRLVSEHDGGGILVVYAYYDADGNDPYWKRKSENFQIEWKEAVKSGVRKGQVGSNEYKQAVSKWRDDNFPSDFDRYIYEK